MSSVVQTVDSPHSSSPWPLRLRSPKPQGGISVRTIRIGLLGLGQVGQAVARLAADRAATAQAGIRFHVEQALVRDLAKPRSCPSPGRVTNDASNFVRGHYDVVIEALDAVEPARTLVAGLLGRGTSVVTANKALVADHAAYLESIAAARGAAFRYEATALAAVPFLGTLADRPLVASVDRVRAIVNGTSNFVLTLLAEGRSFDEALGTAQRLGYAEPNPSRDLDGLDATDKLLLLTSLFGWGRLSREALDISGIRQVTADDLGAARSIGGTIKAVVSAERDATGVRAFVGPAFLPVSEPLASLGGALNGIRLDGRHVSNLFFSGPGAGPGVTAATLLDDAVQAAAQPRKIHDRPQRSQQRVFPSSPSTQWFLRVTFPGVLPASGAVASIVATSGLPVEHVADFGTANSRWLLIGSQGRNHIDAALAKLLNTHRIDAAAFRRL
ncbi:MAG TPA: homoserine dehydrogenase [Vicinamibacterales bacterium]|nr:homoserine dehydrogenase [Vicinamibacterales bacterium]